jgi:hypothetical protein
LEDSFVTVRDVGEGGHVSVAGDVGAGVGKVEEIVDLKEHTEDEEAVRVHLLRLGDYEKGGAEWQEEVVCDSDCGEMSDAASVILVEMHGVEGIGGKEGVLGASCTVDYVGVAGCAVSCVGCVAVVVVVDGDLNSVGCDLEDIENEIEIVGVAVHWLVVDLIG